MPEKYTEGSADKVGHII